MAYATRSRTRTLSPQKDPEAKKSPKKKPTPKARRTPRARALLTPDSPSPEKVTTKDTQQSLRPKTPASIAVESGIYRRPATRSTTASPSVTAANSSTAFGDPGTPTQRKRPRDDPNEDSVQNKRSKAALNNGVPKTLEDTKAPPKIRKVSEPPELDLHIFVCGQGPHGELGLNPDVFKGKKPMFVGKPLLNNNLCREYFGILQFDCGQTHGIALNRDGVILTWGSNETGALGRETKSELDSDGDTNLKEAVPDAIEDYHLDTRIRYTQVVASESASFALREDGKVVGWGSFKVSSTDSPQC